MSGAPEIPADRGTPGGGARPCRRSFPGFLATQFLGAANDNVLKTFITLQATSGLWREEAGPGAAGFITVLFTVPFLLLSGFAGQFADRFSKRIPAEVLLEVYPGAADILASG